MSYDLEGLFGRVKAELERAPRTPISSLARQFGVNRHTITRAVLARTGLTFRSLQRDVLYARACELLQNEPGKSIKEIAVLLGYGSTRAFGRFLAKTCGCTPTLLRETRVPETAADKRSTIEP